MVTREPGTGQTPPEESKASERKSIIKIGVRCILGECSCEKRY